MLRKETQFWESLLFVGDCVVLVLAWVAAYWLRFETGLPSPLGQPPLLEYLPSLVFMPFLWGLVYRGLALYSPRRRGNRMQEWGKLLQAALIVTLGLTSVSYLAFKLNPSRMLLALFGSLALVGLFLNRIVFRESVRFARRRGLNVRNVLIVGTDELARIIRERLRLHPELGMQVKGFVCAERSPDSTKDRFDGLPVVGALPDLVGLVREQGIDHVFVSLTPKVQLELEDVLPQLEAELVDVNLVSDLYRHALVERAVEDFEGLPVINVATSPMAGWNGVVKRTFDLLASGALMLLFAPVFLGLTIFLRLRHGSPVFYRQERMGLDGRTFVLTKFRTMRTDAEATGAMWSQDNDPRCTRVGRFMRRTSLDELPQLWNVFRGEMSLVGPRPERPVFVKEFRSSIPRYMVRHRVKAGLTGWAQVNGLRGNTSVEDRLAHDLFYIRNWSLGLDLRILWRTLMGGFLNRSA